jgi:integrase
VLSRRDIPLREKTLYRMLYETAAPAAEILFLNIEVLNLENRRAPLTSKGGDVEWVYRDTGTARLLPRLLRLPDGSVRTRGPLSPNDALSPHADPGQSTSAPTPDGPDSATTAFASSWSS